MMDIDKNRKSSPGEYLKDANFFGLLEDLHRKLYDLQDLKYRDMQIKIIPNVNPESIIGVRTPELKTMAKEILKAGNYKDFLGALPHKYFEENQLHAFIISGIKDLNDCMEELEKFLPYVDNWATCDQMSPKIFKKHKEELFIHIKEWLSSEKTYTIRFGVGMLMEHFLDEDYDSKYPEMVAKLRSEEYYVNMMIAWYFATALAKQYESILPFIEEKRLDDWTHNKAIQKSVESRRITDEQKKYLKSLKV
nr:DNA alkylation repair protein [Butyrivibrio sp. WCE2006]